MAGQGRGLTDSFLITKLENIAFFGVYRLTKACRNWLTNVRNQC